MDSLAQHTLYPIARGLGSRGLLTPYPFLPGLYIGAAVCHLMIEHGITNRITILKTTCMSPSDKLHRNRFGNE